MKTRTLKTTMTRLSGRLRKENSPGVRRKTNKSSRSKSLTGNPRTTRVVLSSRIAIKTPTKTALITTLCRQIRNLSPPRGTKDSLSIATMKLESRTIRQSRISITTKTMKESHPSSRVPRRGNSRPSLTSTRQTRTVSEPVHLRRMASSEANTRKTPVITSN